MSDDDVDGFTLVKYKHPRRNKYRKKPSGLHVKEFLTSPTSQTSDDKKMDLMINYIKQCKLELKSSLFYAELLKSVSEIVSENVIHCEIVDTPKFQDFVCYGIGKISECPAARYQFALLVLLWQHFKPSGKCYIYDPVFGSLEQQIVEHFELMLISKNEEAKRNVCHKTLFFVPHGGKPLYNNILWANWGPGLQNVVIFGNSFASYQERIPMRQLELEARYIARILPMMHEVMLTSSFDHDIFNDLSLHYFVENQLCQQPSSFWQDCKEPLYEDNNTEIILNTL